MRKFISSSCIFIFFFTLAIFPDFSISSSPAEQVNQKESFLLRLYAFDNEGNQVNDLKDNDLEIYINGKIENTKNWELVPAKSATNLIGDKKKVLKIIILDNTFTSPVYFEKAKTIISGIVNDSGKSVRFLVYQFDPVNGIEKIRDFISGEDLLRDLFDRISPKTGKWQDFLFGKRVTKQVDPGRKIRSVRENLYGKKKSTGNGIDPAIIETLKKNYSGSMEEFKDEIRKNTPNPIAYLISGPADQNILYYHFDKYNVDVVNNLFKSPGISGDKRSIWELIYEKESENGFSTLFSIDMIGYFDKICKSLLSSGAILFRTGNMPPSAGKKEGVAGIRDLKDDDPGRILKDIKEKRGIGITDLINKLTRTGYFINLKNVENNVEEKIINIRCKKKDAYLIYPIHVRGIEKK